MRYLDIATDIYNWLAKHQVSQKEINSVGNGDKLNFNLQHPLKDFVNVTCEMPKKKYFLSHGIGLKIPPTFSK